MMKVVVTMMKVVIVTMLFILMSHFTYAQELCDIEHSKQQLSELSWLTEDYPPYNFVNNQGKLVGSSTETLLAIFEFLELTLDVDNIEVMPWARLYYQLENYPGYGVFSMLGTKERRQKFNMVAMPFIERVSILVLKSRYNEIKTLPIHRIRVGVVREDIGHQLLKASGIIVKQVVSTSANNILKQLMARRIDAIAYTDSVISFKSDQVIDKNDSLVPFLTLDDANRTHFAFHKDADPCMVTLFTDALATLHQRGDILPIYDKYY